MAAHPPEVNPFLRPPLRQRLGAWLRWIASFPYLVYEGYRSWSVPLQRTVLGMGILAGLFLAFFGGRYYMRKSDEMAVMRRWVTINDDIRRNAEPKEIIAGLDKVLEIFPTDVQAVKYKTLLQTGEADPSDELQMILVYRMHGRAGDTDKMLREAEKRLKYEPRDFQAHHILAQGRLGKQDVNGAIPHLKALMEPHVNSVNVNFDAVAWSLSILGNAGQDVSKLREFTAQNIHKRIQADEIAHADPELQATTLYLFSETFELPRLPQDTYTAWPASRKIAEICLDASRTSGKTHSVKKMALVAPRFAAAISQMHASKQVSDAQRTEMSADLEDRTRRCWQFVLEKEPKLPDAYYGLMQSYARSGMTAEALRTLVRGMEACGDSPQLLSIFANVSMQNSGSLDAYRILKTAAERNPDYPKYWLYAARCAYHAAPCRRDLAFLCLDHALQVMPKDLDVICTYAEYTTGTGYPELVLKNLAPIGDAQLIRMPNAISIFTRALAEIGDTERLDYVLAQAMEVSRASNNPQPAIMAAKGVNEAQPASSERSAKVAEYLVPITERWNLEYPLASHLQAAALSKVCELKPGPVDPILARNAILSCERALAADANNLATVTNLTLYRLVGDKDPAKAMSEATLLIENAAKLVPEQAEVLAMLYNANKMPNEAVRSVQSHTASRPTAGCWTQLAVAYLQQGRTDDAKAALENAAKLNRSDREHRDYLKASEQVAKGRP